MQTSLYLQYTGREMNLTDLEKRAKEEWKNQNRKIKDINSLEIYVKPEDSKAYVAINGVQFVALDL